MAGHPSRYSLVEGDALPAEDLGTLARDDGEDELVVLGVDEEDGPVEGTEEGAYLFHHAIEDAADRVLRHDALADRREERELHEVAGAMFVEVVGHWSLRETVCRVHGLPTRKCVRAFPVTRSLPSVFWLRYLAGIASPLFPGEG